MKIERLDAVTFEVQGSEKTPYMVFKSIHKDWVCDCMNFVMNMSDNGDNKPCKHIKEIKRVYNLT
jgi:hypothetical protein